MKNRLCVLLCTLFGMSLFVTVSCKTVRDGEEGASQLSQLTLRKPTKPEVDGVLLFATSSGANCSSQSFPVGVGEDEWKKVDSYKSFSQLSNGTIDIQLMSTCFPYTVRVYYTCNKNGGVRACYQGTATAKLGPDGKTASVTIDIVDINTGSQEGVTTGEVKPLDVNLTVNTNYDDGKKPAEVTVRDFIVSNCRSNLGFPESKIALAQDCSSEGVFYRSAGNYSTPVYPVSEDGNVNLFKNNTSYATYKNRYVIYEVSFDGQSKTLNEALLNTKVTGVNKVKFKFCKVGIENNRYTCAPQSTTYSR